MLIVETSNKGRFYNVAVQEKDIIIHYTEPSNEFIITFKHNHHMQMVYCDNFRIFGYVPSTENRRIKR